jgi:hypothetical protein
MIPKISGERQHKSNTTNPFDDLVIYMEGDNSNELQLASSNKFCPILNYTSAPLDKTTKGEKCIAIRTHGVGGITTAAIEMNAVAARNTRCKDPVYHIILSWPEYEKPDQDAIFDAAEHALKSLNLDSHQYVVAIHGNTDNIHCHIAVNRIHPETFKSRNIEWSKKSLHWAARKSEIKHNWTHDNGIYIVQLNENNEKIIILNPDHDYTLPHAHREIFLPVWHDPDSLESWLKTKVAKSLKRDLPDIDGWNALHSWLSKYDITLTDTGGGGMRLYADNPETGEILDIPASKGLRLLKRAELENRWGKFKVAISTPCIAPDFSGFSSKQTANKVEAYLAKAFVYGIPPDHVIHYDENILRQETDRSSGLYEMQVDKLDADLTSGELFLPIDLREQALGNQTGQDQVIQRPRSNDSGREDRKLQRARARVELQKRFALYKGKIRDGETNISSRIKEIRYERSQAIKAINAQCKSEKSVIRKDNSISPDARLLAMLCIDAAKIRKKNIAEVTFRIKNKTIKETRPVPMAWRYWLKEQAQLGDQAALSALRGIVYQEKRDAKRGKSITEGDEISEVCDAESSDKQFRKLMERLQEAEIREVAIRSASINQMRPCDADALRVSYTDIQWFVTGNGNIEYRDKEGQHLFTDRGSRITFDKDRVPDLDIRLALLHAKMKFGNQLTLTGDDRKFAERMALLADDMGITILNPELKSVIELHRNKSVEPLNNEENIREINSNETQSPQVIKSQFIKPMEQENLLDESPQANEMEIQLIAPEFQTELTPEMRLRAQVLSIDPDASFVIPDSSDKATRYIGPVATALEPANGSEPGFAQHIGRGVYALHFADVPDNHGNNTINVQYRKGIAVITVPISIEEERDER